MFTQKVCPVEPQKKRTTIEEACDTLYIFQRSNDLIPNQDSISEHELDNLLDGYLKTLDNLISKLQKGQKAKNENKIYKPSVYYQKSTKPNQYKTHISRSGSQNSYEVETEVEKTIYLSSNIKASVQEVYLEIPCPSTTIGDLELYYVLESSKENDSADLVTD
ncbi:12807_t:CDS:2 [Gigaspora margarita]|uniref:12807_t:CDS:1 n=1 Tax=Gigaspora margarita TaxID=4874 RepID=A0ABN7VVT7_GIGMA|nr:12807_t:CDS:2 [Gigaspora margarita]